MRSNQKAALITGGGKGIGAEVVRHLLSQNWRVVIAELDDGLKKDHLKDEQRLLFLKTDIRKESSVEHCIKQSISYFGRLDALVNNAGVLPKESMPLEKLPLRKWQEYIDTNLTGAFLCAKYAIPHLRKSKGSIVNIASTRALQSEGGNEPYSASKGGLVALTHEMAVSLGPEIRVNCISPGWINTQQEILKKKDHEQHPAGRVGKVEDIAYMVAFLISDEASFITGQNFIVDGGMTIKMIYN